MVTYLIVQSWIAAVVAIMLGWYAGYQHARAIGADEKIYELENPEPKEEDDDYEYDDDWSAMKWISETVVAFIRKAKAAGELVKTAEMREEEEAERARAEQQKREKIAELKEQKYASEQRSGIGMIAAALCAAFFVIVQYALNYSDFTLSIVALDVFLVMVTYVEFGDDADPMAMILVCLAFVAMIVGLGLGVVRVSNAAVEASKPDESQAYTEVNDAGETWRWIPMEESEAHKGMAAENYDVENKMYYDSLLVPYEEKHIHDEVLNADVAVEVVGNKAKYTLTREDLYYGARSVTVWAGYPSATWDDEDALTTMYIQFDFAPKGRNGSWVLENAYTYHTKLRTGTLVYRLEMIDAPALELDADMMVLIDAALDGKMRWKHTECQLYMDESEEIDLSALLESYGYRFAGLDPVKPRGFDSAEDVADSRWMVYTNGYSTVRLLDDKSGRIFWLMCDSGGEWSMDLVPMMVPDDFSTAVKVHGAEFSTYDWLVATLVQYLERVHVSFYDFPEDGATVSQYYYADWGVEAPVIGEAA